MKTTVQAFRVATFRSFEKKANACMQTCRRRIAYVNEISLIKAFRQWRHKIGVNR